MHKALVSANNGHDSEKTSLLPHSFQLPFYGPASGKNSQKTHKNVEIIKKSFPVVIPLALYALCAVVWVYSWQNSKKCHAGDNQYALTCSEEKREFIGMSCVLGLSTLGMIAWLLPKVTNLAQQNLQEPELASQESPAATFEP